MKKQLLGVVAAFGLAFFASQASAATFDFTGVNELDSSSKSFSAGGINLTVTAGTFGTASNPSNINFNTRLVDLDPDGLGADGPLDGDQVDGGGGNDVLVFTFDTTVTIDSIVFGNVDSNDDFSFGSVDGASYTRFVNFQDVVSPIAASSFLTLAERTGTAFGIGAIGPFDNFTIKGLTVTAVPLPAALPLFMGALSLLGFLGWRRKRVGTA